MELVFGIIKESIVFRGFSLRGKDKGFGEWTLVCLAYNLRLLHGMIGGTKNGRGKPKPPSAGVREESVTLPLSAPHP